MSSICFMVVYFGKLPASFQLWLNSCKHNKTVDFIVITDDKSEFDVPENVKLIYTSFKEVTEKIKSIFEYDISLETPYKLCDYKPAYGEAFQEYISEYDYWGYCDIDLIWGDIRKFLTEDILNSHDRILTRGHCSIFKNTKEINSLYRTLRAEGCQIAKEVYQSSESRCFDEWAGHCGWGISEIFKRNQIKQYDEIIFADINFLKYKFSLTDRRGFKSMPHLVFQFHQGQLSAVYMKNNEVTYEQFMYVHFQKRHLQINTSASENVLIIPPNKVVNHTGTLSKRTLKKLTFQKGIYTFVVKFRMNQVKTKLKRSIQTTHAGSPSPNKM